MLNQPLFAALDVSLATTTICIMSADGTIIKEAVVATEPESIAICLGDDLTRIERIGRVAGPRTFRARHRRHPLGNTPGPSCLVGHDHQETMTSLKRPVRAASSATAPEWGGIPAGSSSRAKGP